MKRLIRLFLFSGISIYIVSRYIGGISYSNDVRVLLIAAGFLSLINVVIKPIIKIVTLPINLLTLGLFGSFVNGLLLYLVTYAVPKFTVSAFTFNGYSYHGFIVPEVHFPKLGALLICSIALSWIVSMLDWLTD